MAPSQSKAWSKPCSRKPWSTCGGDPEHSSGPISSLFVASDVADDVCDVLIAIFFVGNEGGIVVVIAFDGLVDLDVVFRFGNHGLDLAGILLGVGLLERNQLFGLGGLRHIGGGGGRSGGGGACGIATGGPRWRNRRNRHDLTGVGRDHRGLVQIVEFLTRRRANAFGSEIGLGHVGILGISEKRCFTWLVERLVSIAVLAFARRVTRCGPCGTAALAKDPRS